MTTLCPAVPTICQLGTRRLTQPCRPAARQRLPPVLRLPPLPAHAAVHPQSQQPVDPAPLHVAPAAAPGLAARLAAPGVLRSIALCAAAAALAAAMPGAARAAAAAAADSGGGGLAAWAQCEITAGTCVHSATRMPGYASRLRSPFYSYFLAGSSPPAAALIPQLAPSLDMLWPCSCPEFRAAPGRSSWRDCESVWPHHLLLPLRHCVCGNRWADGAAGWLSGRGCAEV